MRQKHYQEHFHRKIQQPGYEFTTDEYDKFQVIYVCRGHVVFETMDLCSEIGTGNIILLRQSSSFSLHCRQEGYEGVAYSAIGGIKEEFIGDSETLGATDDIRTIGNMMDRLLERAPSYASGELRGLARALVWESIRLSETVYSRPAKGRRGRELAESACALLQSHIYTSRPVRHILSALPISYRHLCRHFKSKYGMSPKQFQLHAKTKEARRMLAHTDLDITSIAMELGYSSSQHFSTQFKNAAGMSPTEWRKEHTGDRKESLSGQS